MNQLATLPANKQTYVRERIAGKNKMQSALAAGYAPSSARIAAQAIETPDVKAVFRSLCQRALPMTKLAERLAEGIDATTTQFFQKDGVVMDKRDTIAWSERRAYLELAAEYAGYVEKDAPALSVQIGSLSLALPEVEQPALPVAQDQPVIDLAPVESAEPSSPVPASVQ